ncbi:Putative zinc finger protein At1g68190 [Linum perenne]
MDKFCEFCTQLRAVVFCKADLAYLCLACDTKVHSANALSSRHLRSVLCDSCRLQSASVQCLNHKVFLCHDCERSSIHELCAPDQKREVSSYMGSPSAKDFAVLWGLRLDELHKRAADTQLCSTSAGPVASSFGFSGRQTQGSSRISKKKSCSALKSGEESDVISSSYLTKVSAKVEMKQETSFILQQIKDLGNLQLAEVDGTGSVPRSSSRPDIIKKFKNRYDHLQEHQDFGSGIQSSITIAPPEVKVDLVSSFSIPESLPLTSTAANGLLGESFWHCKSPFQNSQLWSQTMQDLGICEDVCCDDLNIPDVDISFRNFEELFGGDQEPIREMIDEKDASSSSLEKKMSLDKSNNCIAMATSFASSVCGSHPHQLDKNRDPLLNQVDNPMEDPHVIYTGSSCPTMSFSVSRQSAESIATEDLDSAASSL